MERAPNLGSQPGTPGPREKASVNMKTTAARPVVPFFLPMNGPGADSHSPQLQQLLKPQSHCLGILSGHSKG